MKKRLQRLITFVLLSSILLAVIPYPQTHAEYGNGYVGGRMGDGVGIYAYGVDISSWQDGEVDFRKIKAQGYSFVILRAGFSVYIDRYFERNYAAAKAAGLHVGVYLYSYADTVEEVLKEAEALKGWLSGKKLEYPVYYDMEEPETHGQMSPEALTELSMAFLDSMASDGWLVGLYSCKSWLQGKLETDIICEKYECWMALYLWSGSYDTYDQYDEYCGLWQYSSTGSVDGVPGNVDMNVAFKDYPGICMQYGLNGYTASGENLLLSGGKEIPKVIASGESLDVSGKVISNHGKISNVTVGIYDDTGAQVCGRSAGPRTESYDISELASSVNTENLADGRYTFRIVATNTKGTKILCQQNFVISPIGLMSTGVTAPDHLYEGTNYIPQGELLASTILEEVYLSVTDAEGNEIRRAVAEPKKDAYALQGLASDLNTQTLTLGQYRYTLTVRTQIGTQTLVDTPFYVWVEDDPITLTGTVMNSEYLLDELTTLSGTVSSEKSELKVVKVSILNREQQQTIMSAQAFGGQQIPLSEVAQGLSLQSLPYGAYICQVEATNDGGPVILLSKEFLIQPDGMSLCDPDVPVTLYCGDSYLISGAVTSDHTPLEFVAVTVVDELGQVAFDEVVTTQTFVYDLSDIATKLRFSDLQVGKYTLRISARNASATQVVYDSVFQVIDTQDYIFWSEKPCSPNGISYASYDSIQFYGTLESTASEISAVTAEVFAQNEALVNSAAFAPRSQTTDIENFNDMLRLSALPSGKYRLVITATNAAHDFVMLDEVFYISACNHSNVRSGVVHEQRCDRIGAICDSRCTACGERTQQGAILPPDVHEWTGDGCVYCGKTQMKHYTLYQSRSIHHLGRYMLAHCEEGQWYALNIWGETVAIEAPDAEGILTVGAELLWTANIQSDGMYFTNPFGQRMHLDSEGICVANGVVNTLLDISCSDDYFYISVQGRQRALLFDQNLFQSGQEATAAALFELPCKGK